MRNNLRKSFIYSAGIILLITGMAKLISSAGAARLLQYPDPILLISFRHLFWIVGCIELVVAFVCLRGGRELLQVGLLACFSSVLLVYRLGLLWLGYQKPCPCLGNLTGVLHLSPESADRAMKLILGYLLLGSYSALFWLCTQARKTHASVKV